MPALSCAGSREKTEPHSRTASDPSWRPASISAKLPAASESAGVGCQRLPVLGSGGLGISGNLIEKAELGVELVIVVRSCLLLGAAEEIQGPLAGLLVAARGHLRVGQPAVARRKSGYRDQRAGGG